MFSLLQKMNQKSFDLESVMNFSSFVLRSCCVSFLVLIIGLFWTYFLFFSDGDESRVKNTINKPEIVLLELQKTIPADRLLWKTEEIQPYTRYKTIGTPGNPDMVVFPVTVEEIITIAKLCYFHEYVMIPMGLNTAVEGQSVTTNGGIVINMMKMNKVLKVHPDDYQATIEPGIRINELNEELKLYGLVFPVSPSSNPSVGGCVSTRGSGMLTPKYLSVKENIISLEVVLANGDLIKTGRRSVKSSAGYDLTSLFVGSEGTLGIITKIVVKAVPLPNIISAATVSFPSGIHGATSTVVKLMGIENNGISRLELMNKQGMISLNQHSKTSHDENPSLFFEFYGEDEEDIKKKSDRARSISEEYGGLNFRISSDEKERKNLWKTRMEAFYAFYNTYREECFIIDEQPQNEKRRKQSCHLFATDYCVPISQLGTLIEYCEHLFESYAPKLKGNLVVHAGDGNLHHGILIDFENEEEVELMEMLHTKMMIKTLELDGTIAGEHGVGIKKKHEMSFEYNEETLNVMKSIKKAIDPKNIMNPGKIV